MGVHMLLSCEHAMEVCATVDDCGCLWVDKRSSTVALSPSLHYCHLQVNARKFESEVQRAQQLWGAGDLTKSEIFELEEGWDWKLGPNGDWIPRANPNIGPGGLHRMAGQGSWVQQADGYREHYVFATFFKGKTKSVNYPGSNFKRTLVFAEGGDGPITGSNAGGKSAVSSHVKILADF
jgi:hypothetical protein